MKKIVLMIIDGLGDRPVSSLEGKTPLEAAITPNLDKWAREGACGLVSTFQFPFEGKPTSEGTHIALFGFKESFLGRGPYEAAGCGIELKEGDLAFRVNFATVGDDLVVKDRRAGRIKEKQILIDALSGIEIKGIKFLLKNSVEHRAALVLRGKGLSDKVGKNDPGETGVKTKEIKAILKEGEFTARILNKFIQRAYDILKDHPFNRGREFPANYLLIRGSGVYEEIKGFEDKYGLRGCCVAGGSLYKGIAKTVGMELVESEKFTGRTNTDLESKFKALNKCLKKYDFIFCHIKGTDTLGHDGDCRGKKKFIEKIDKNVPLLSREEDVLWVITADHSTPCEIKDHSEDPVPILVYGAFADKTKEFSEKECAKGALGRMDQEEVMDRIIQLAKE